MKNFIKYLLFFIFCIFYFVCFSQNDQTKKDYFRIESKYIDNDTLLVSDLYMQAIIAESLENDSVKVVSILKQLLNIDSLHAPTLFKLAMYGTNNEKSEEYINKAISLDSTNVDYHSYKYLLYKNQNRYDEAIKVCDKIIELDDTKLNFHVEKASLYAYSNRPYDAISTIENAISIYGERLELLHFLQYMYNVLKLQDKVIEIGLKMHKIMPDNIDFIKPIISSYLEQNNPQKAKEYLDIAAQIDSTSLDYLFGISDYYNKYGTTKQHLTSLVNLFSNKELPVSQKIDYFNSVIKNREFYQNYFYDVEAIVSAIRIAHAGDWEVDKLYAQHLINIGETKAASNVYKKYISIPSENQLEAFQQVIGIENYLAENIDSLLNHSMTAVNLFPENIDLKFQVAHVYATHGHFKTAVDIMKWCIKRTSNDSLKSIYTGSLGDLYHLYGNMKTTYKYYDKALKLNPNNVVVLNNYSYFLSEENQKLDKALYMATLAITAEPDNPTYLDTYGWILHKMGRNKEAIEIIRRAIALDNDNNDELLIHLGDIFFDMNDIISAEIYWDRALKAGAEANEIEERKKKIK